MKKLKLTIDLIPQTTWGENIRNRVTRKYWGALRRKVYSRAGYRCEVCGIKPEGQMHCHEVWTFLDLNRIQRLEALQALCWMCHRVKHYGWAQTHLNEGDLDQVHKHFMRVNKLTAIEMFRHMQEARSAWEKRTKVKWQIDLNGFDQGQI